MLVDASASSGTPVTATRTSIGPLARAARKDAKRRRPVGCSTVARSVSPPRMATRSQGTQVLVRAKADPSATQGTSAISSPATLSDGRRTCASIPTAPVPKRKKKERSWMRWSTSEANISDPSTTVTRPNRPRVTSRTSENARRRLVDAARDQTLRQTPASTTQALGRRMEQELVVVERPLRAQAQSGRSPGRREVGLGHPVRLRGAGRPVLLTPLDQRDLTAGLEQPSGLAQEGRPVLGLVQDQRDEYHVGGAVRQRHVALGGGHVLDLSGTRPGR